MKGCRSLAIDEIAKVSRSFSGRYAVRDKALFVLGCCSGLRISELLSIKVGDVIEPTGLVGDRVYIRRQSTKGRREGRSILLHAAARDALVDWLAELEGRGPLRPDAFVFHGQKGAWRPMTTTHAWRILKDAFIQAGLSGKVATHSMRKSFAASMYHGLGGDLVATQQALGHANVNSTISYLSVSQERIDAAIMQMTV